jgi:hypothetical protein
MLLFRQLARSDPCPWIRCRGPRGRARIQLPRKLPRCGRMIPDRHRNPMPLPRWSNLLHRRRPLPTYGRRRTPFRHPQCRSKKTAGKAR